MSTNPLNHLQDMFRESVRKFLCDEVAPLQQGFEAAGQPTREVWKALGDMVSGLRVSRLPPALPLAGVVGGEHPRGAGRGGRLLPRRDDRDRGAGLQVAGPDTSVVISPTTQLLLLPQLRDPLDHSDALHLALR